MAYCANWFKDFEIVAELGRQPAVGTKRYSFNRNIDDEINGAAGVTRPFIERVEIWDGVRWVDKTAELYIV